MKSIRIHKHGGADVLVYEEAPLPKPGPGEALVEIHVSGVNFVDTYFRAGLYKPPSMPFIPGSEAAGVVAAVGENVNEVHVGYGVAYAKRLGSVAVFAVVPHWIVACLLRFVDFREVAT